MSYKDIVFDFGGVIVDIDRNQAVKRFEEIGISDANSLLGEYKQEGLLLQLEEGQLSRWAFYDGLRSLVGKEIPNERIDYAWFGFMLPVQQERLDFLLELRKKYRVSLLSNTNPIIMSWARSSQFTLAGKPLDDYFDRLYLSYEMGVTKPSARIFQKMIEDGGMDPAETLFVDDGAANIAAATALGFQTYLCKPGEDYRKFFQQ